MSLTNVRIIDENESLPDKFGFYLEKLIKELLNQTELITIGLSGGSLIDILASILPQFQLPWTRLRFFFVDERFVPFTSEDSTFANYEKKLFRQLPLSDTNIIKIDPTLQSVEQVAQDYQIKLKEILRANDQSFDIVLLGMGPDGHTASLFPNHPALDINQDFVTFINDSPKPPSQRITLTLNTINRAKYKIVLVTGQSKSTIVKQVIQQKDQTYPIARIENLIWYLDKPAASQLSIIRPT